MRQPEATPSGNDVPAQGRELVVYRGLPGSGKTTHAQVRVRALRRAGTLAARVGRDDVRDAMRVSGAGNPAAPDRVTVVHHAIVATLFQRGCAVIFLDDAHLAPEHLAAVRVLAQRVGAVLKIQDLRAVPLEVCIARDGARPPRRQAGRATIAALAARYRLPRTASTETVG
jgi:predicted kinase